LKQILVFSNTKIGASRLARHLEQQGVKASAIHGDKSQAERMAALEAFKSGAIDVLVATDVAARGLDIAELPCVINYDLPYNAEDYVHRIGRTGRAGASGDAISLYSAKDERLLIDIEKMIKHKFVPAELAGFVPPSARSAERRPRREDGELRPAPASARSGPPRGDSGRGDSSRSDFTRSESGRSAYSPSQRKEKIDPWFLKPYEASVAEAPATGDTAATSSTVKPQKVKVAALLGGTPKR
jgi:superfamily II DNA/RNA helicase